MPEPLCAKLEARLDEAVQGRLATSLAAHAGTCSRCRRLVARQRALEALLDAQPEPPEIDLPPPSLPEPAAPSRLRLLLPRRALRWSAAAAAALAMGVVGWEAGRNASGHRGGEGSLLGQVARVRSRTIVDVPGAPPPADERLLALTSGVEAVAMRRPTEVR